MPPRHQRADARFQRAIGAGDGEERMAFAELASFANVEEGDFRPVVHQGLGLRRGNCPAHACGSLPAKKAWNASRTRRSEERRGGKECVRTCRYRWWRYN